MMRLNHNDYAENTDRVISDFNSGVMAAFQDVFHLHYRSLVYFAVKLSVNHHEAEDIVQNIFIRLWEKRADFNSIHAIKSFLFLSTKNSCIDLKRHARVAEVFAQDSIEDGHQAYESPVDFEILESDIIAEVNRAIEKLPARCREVMVLSLRGMKNHEIADHLGVSINTVKTQRQRALTMLRQQVGPELLAFLLLFAEQIYR